MTLVDRVTKLRFASKTEWCKSCETTTALELCCRMLLEVEENLSMTELILEPPGTVILTVLEFQDEIFFLTKIALVYNFLNFPNQ